MRFWLIAVFVAGGILYGVVEPGRLTYAFGHTTLYILLPPLLFEAAWNLHFGAVRRQWTTIGLLAGPAVMGTAVIVAAALVAARFPVGPALLTGTILSATDPIAVVGIFRQLRVPILLATIVEGEALFNDAVAVVLYRAVLLAMAVGFSAGAVVTIVMQSLLAAAGGIALGVLVAFAAAILLRNRTGQATQIVATIVCAYAAYFLAEVLHLSGIFATIAAGIALRRLERSWIALNIARAVDDFWKVGAVTANAVLFFLVGAALSIASIAHDPAFVVATIAGVIVARAVVIELFRPCGFPKGWVAVIRSAGLRGALSLALAIALPASTPFRAAIIDSTFAVVLISLLLGGQAVQRASEKLT